MLATLTGCLLFITSDRNSVTAFATCTTCDNNYSICEGNCHTDYNNCRINSPDSYCFPIFQSCRDGCLARMRAASALAVLIRAASAIPLAAEAVLSANWTAWTVVKSVLLMEVPPAARTINRVSKAAARERR